MTVDHDTLLRENAELRERVASAERNTARTLLRATRLAQVISVLAQDSELDAIVERAAVELGELFGADVALLSLGPDHALEIAGHYGVRPRDLPERPFALPGPTAGEHVRIGPGDEVPVPGFLAPYGARHVAWARLVAGEESLGHLTLVRRAPHAFERSDADELRAISHRISLAIENGRLHRRMSGQLARLRHIHDITTELAGTIELDAIARRIAQVLVEDVPTDACSLSVERLGNFETLSHFGSAGADADWQDIALQAAGISVGRVAVAGAPAHGTEERETMDHLLGIAALALQKALLYERSREQARRDSLTGLLAHQAFQERLEALIAGRERFCVALIDIDDFKQVNDLHGHLVGDETLRRVAAVMRGAARAGDELYRTGGEEFCAVLLDVDAEEGFAIAERLRRRVAAMREGLPVTVSVGLAGHPDHGALRDEVLTAADVALYHSKRTGKNRTTTAGAAIAPQRGPSDREVRLALLHEKDPETVVHSTHVTTLAVELGRELDLDEERMADLRTAAQLHDIGKVAVPDDVLRKHGPLAPDEERLLRVHPTVGASLLRAWGLTTAARFVEEHHERLDGTGYPHGLAGAQIALESRIIAVADAHVRGSQPVGDPVVDAALRAVTRPPVAHAA